MEVAVAFSPRTMKFGHSSDTPLDEAEEQLVRQVIGAAIAVHRALGPGYLEAVYEEALAVELERQSLPFQRQAPFEIRYRDHVVGRGRLDLLVAQAVIVELKAVENMTPLFKAQTISYLRATGKRVALLINFNVPVLKEGIKRILL
jgi:GxxExxY protein